MMKLLQAPLTAMLLGGLSFLFTVFALVEKPLADSVHPVLEPEEEEEAATAAFWQQHNPEVDEMVRELRREKEEMARREADLRQLAAQLRAEREAINQVTQRVAQVQAEFDQNIMQMKAEEIPNLKKQTKRLATMSPEGVAAIFREMDDATVVKLMGLMKEDQSALLLDSMTKEGDAQAKRAASISEALIRTMGDKRKAP